MGDFIYSVMIGCTGMGVVIGLIIIAFISARDRVVYDEPTDWVAVLTGGCLGVVAAIVICIVVFILFAAWSSGYIF